MKKNDFTMEYLVSRIERVLNGHTYAAMLEAVKFVFQFEEASRLLPLAQKKLKWLLKNANPNVGVAACQFVLHTPELLKPPATDASKRYPLRLLKSAPHKWRKK